MIEVFNRISQRMIKGIMFHEQMADYFDFCSFNGLKRWQEYRYLEESAELRGLHRYAISHLNKIINDENVGTVSYIPSSWFSATRQQVDNSTRKSSIKDAFEKWYNWEKETLDFYQAQFKILAENGKIAETNKVNELIKSVDQELKTVTRKMLEYKSVDYNLDYIMQEQQCMHDHYYDKQKSIGIDIC